MQLHGPQESSYQIPAIPEKTTYSDSSGTIFSMYISRAQKFDEENAENWKGGAEGILVFVRRLFNIQSSGWLFVYPLLAFRLVFLHLLWLLLFP